MLLIIIAHTIKGKRRIIYGKPSSWQSSLKLSDEDIVKALEDLSATEEEILMLSGNKPALIGFQWVKKLRESW